MKRKIIWEKSIFFFVLFSIAYGTIYMYASANQTKVLMGLLTIALLIAVAFGQQSIRLPSAFVCLLYGFIWIAVAWGTFGGMYKLRHFDDLLHFISGLWLGYGGWLLLIYLLGKEMAGKLPKSFVFLYLVCFSLAGGGAWELLEFAGDKLLHFTAQGRDHDDTMFDMIDGLIGGLLAAFYIAKRH